MSNSPGRPQKLGSHEYLNVRIPEAMDSDIDRSVERGEWEHKSEFVREAIREKLQEVRDV